MERGDLKTKLLIAAGLYDKDILSIEIATINSVDEDLWTCTATPVSGIAQTPITDIQLTAELSSNGFIQVPVIGSNVILAITLRNEVYVLMCSEVDKLIFYRDNGGTFTSFVINENGITMNDGSFNGLVTGPSLTKKINNLENLINDLIIKFNTHAHTGVTTGVGTSGPSTQLETGTINPITQESDIENPNITHGIPLT